MLLCIVTTGIVSAQEFGVVTNEEWGYTPPDQYKDQGAIILFDKGFTKTEFRGVEFKRHIRYKVMHADNLDTLNKVNITHFEYDHVKDLQADIIKPNGTIIEINKDRFKKLEKSRLEEVVFEFPDLSDGDIFEYSYQINYYGGKEKLGPEKYFLFNLNESSQTLEQRGLGAYDDDYYLNLSNIPTWYFDHPVFCKTSEFVVQIGGDLDYSFVPVNLPDDKREPTMERIKVLTATAYKKYTWVLEDIAPFSHREYQGLDYNEINRIGLYFNLFSTVGQNRMISGLFVDDHFRYMGVNFEGYLKQYLNKTKSMVKKAHKIAPKDMEPVDRIDALKNFITDNYTIDSSGFTLRPINNNLKKLYDKKVGSPFELNLLLLELLNLDGFDAYPVLINTNNKVNFRYTGKFNHVIVLVKVDGKDIYADAAFTGCTAGELPAFTYPGEGVLVNKSDSKPILLDAVECKDAVLLKQVN